MSLGPRLRGYLRTGDRPVCLTPQTFAALLELAEAADHFDATDLRVKALWRDAKAGSSDVRELGRARRDLSAALDRVREVAA